MALTNDLVIHPNTQPSINITCSKPFNQLSVSDFTEEVFNSGGRFTYIKNMRVSNNRHSWIYQAGIDTPMYTTGVSVRDYYTSVGSIDGLYSRSIIIACPDSDTDNLSIDNKDSGYKVSKSGHPNWRVVTGVPDIKKLLIGGSATDIFDSAIDSAGDEATLDADTAEKQAALKYNYYKSTSGGVDATVFYDNISYFVDDQNNRYWLKIVYASLIDGELFLRGSGCYGPYDNFGNRATYGFGFYDQGYYAFDNNDYLLQYCPQLWAASDVNLKTGLGLKWVDSSQEGTKEYTFLSSDNYGIKFNLNIVGGFYLYANILRNMHMIMMDIAQSGLLFNINGVLYKPIIINGVVEGYTADMTVDSEFDNWTDVSGHNVPVTPPAPPPPPPGPYDDDPWSGVSFSGVGVGGAGAFARCYYMTSTELANLRTWMSGVGVPEGFDPMAQIIGLSQVPVALSGDAPETVQFINSSAVYDPGVVSRVVDSGVSTQYSMGKPISYSLGSIDITRRMQERGEPYLDYSCQIELYLPLIGTFSLDTQAVMGRTLSAEAILDPISGTLAAYAWVTRDGQKLPVAYGSTTIGIDLPITAQQYSMSRAAAKQINAQFTASMLSSALTTVTAAAAAGSASGAAAGRAGAASGAGIQPASQFNAYAQSASIAGSQTAISQSGNIFGAFMEWGRAVRQLSYGNNTAIAGSFGGSMAQWSYPFTAYVKIIRPRYEKPSNYNHTQGVPCVQTKKIGSCTGLIQCIGADVSGITRATDLERQAIQLALSNGVYAGGVE